MNERFMKNDNDFLNPPEFGFEVRIAPGLNSISFNFIHS